jgi:uncharacterized protein
MVAAHDVLTVGTGSLVGFTLGLVGGGGSILAVPLLIYVAGVQPTHVAIGTSAVAVAASALINLLGHARARTVKWPCAIVFALSGMAGAAGGAALGKLVEGQKLLALFGLLMIAIGLLMMRPRQKTGDPNVRLTRENAQRLLPALIGTGLVTGGLSGFFGIGGGFLIVPGLMGATGMALINAIGSSLLSVTAFGLTSAASYAASDLVDWRAAALFVMGGAAGGLVGIAISRRLASYKRVLSLTFAGLVVTIGIFVAGSAIGGMALKIGA